MMVAPRALAGLAIIVGGFMLVQAIAAVERPEDSPHSPEDDDYPHSPAFWEPPSDDTPSVKQRRAAHEECVAFGGDEDECAYFTRYYGPHTSPLREQR